MPPREVVGLEPGECRDDRDEDAGSAASEPHGEDDRDDVEDERRQVRPGDVVDDPERRDEDERENRQQRLRDRGDPADEAHFGRLSGWPRPSGFGQDPVGLAPQFHIVAFVLRGERVENRQQHLAKILSLHR